MSKSIIEETIRYCNHCKGDTIHHRTAKEMTNAGLLGHFFLTVFTAGIWGVLFLLDLVVIKLTGNKKGKWICKVCGGNKCGLT